MLVTDQSRRYVQYIQHYKAQFFKISTKGEYFYGFMDDTSISESIFVDIEEQYFYPTSSEHPTRKKNISPTINRVTSVITPLWMW